MHAPDPFKVISIELERDANVAAVLLFGSRARAPGLIGSSDRFSDYDLHVVVHSERCFQAKNWVEILKECGLLKLSMLRASDGAGKVVFIFEKCEIDVIVVASYKMMIGRVVLALGGVKWFPAAFRALNNLATIMSGGIRMLKGGGFWRELYESRLRVLEGFRLSDEDLRRIADENVIAAVKVRKRLARGEMVSARRLLHVVVIENNIDMLHELRLRRGVLSFQRGRRVEVLAPRAQLDWLLAGEGCCDIDASARDALRGTIEMMSEMVPSWTIPTVLRVWFEDDLTADND